MQGVHLGLTVMLVYLTLVVVHVRTYVLHPFSHINCFTSLCFATPDINECEDGNHRCEHNCMNTVGSYSCFCDDSQTGGDDGFSCLGKSPHPHVAQGRGQWVWFSNGQ